MFATLHNNAARYSRAARRRRVHTTVTCGQHKRRVRRSTEADRVRTGIPIDHAAVRVSAAIVSAGPRSARRTSATSSALRTEGESSRVFSTTADADAPRHWQRDAADSFLTRRRADGKRKYPYGLRTVFFFFFFFRNVAAPLDLGRRY